MSKYWALDRAGLWSLINIIPSEKKIAKLLFTCKIDVFVIFSFITILLSELYNWITGNTIYWCFSICLQNKNNFRFIDCSQVRPWISRPLQQPVYEYNINIICSDGEIWSSRKVFVPTGFVAIVRPANLRLRIKIIWLYI